MFANCGFVLGYDGIILRSFFETQRWLSASLELAGIGIQAVRQHNIIKTIEAAAEDAALKLARAIGK